MEYHMKFVHRHFVLKAYTIQSRIKKFLNDRKGLEPAYAIILDNHLNQLIEQIKSKTKKTKKKMSEPKEVVALRGLAHRVGVIAFLLKKVTLSRNKIYVFS